MLVFMIIAFLVGSSTLPAEKAPDSKNNSAVFNLHDDVMGNELLHTQLRTSLWDPQPDLMD